MGFCSPIALWNKSKSNCQKSPICQYLSAGVQAPNQAGKFQIAPLTISTQADSAMQIYWVFVQGRGSHQGKGKENQKTFLSAFPANIYK